MTSDDPITTTVCMAWRVVILFSDIIAIPIEWLLLCVPRTCAITEPRTALLRLWPPAFAYLPLISSRPCYYCWRKLAWLLPCAFSIVIGDDCYLLLPTIKLKADWPEKWWYCYLNDPTSGSLFPEQNSMNSERCCWLVAPHTTFTCLAPQLFLQHLPGVGVLLLFQALQWEWYHAYVAPPIQTDYSTGRYSVWLPSSPFNSQFVITWATTYSDDWPDWQQNGLTIVGNLFGYLTDY